MKHLLALISLALITLSSPAQLESLTLEDAILKGYSDLSPERLSQLQWIPASHDVSHVNTSEEDPTLYRQSSSGGELKSIISLSDLKALIPEASFGSFPRYEWLSDTELFIQGGGANYYAVNPKKRTSKALFRLPEGASSIAFNEQKTNCSYILDGNLFIRKADNTNIQVTKDGGEGIVYGQSVHRSEFGITGGMFWSPDGTKLAFYRMDETMVDEYPLIDISSTPAALNQIRYPMAGRTSHHVTLGVYDLKGAPLTYMDTKGPKDQYLTSVGWTPESTTLIIGLLNRDQNHLQVNLYNVRSGFLLKTLFEEKNDKYVEPEHAPWFIPGSNEEFLWMSERDGYQHLYLYNIQGEMKRQVTVGRWEVHDILGFDNTGNYLFVSGTGEVTTDGRNMNTEFNGTQRYVYLVDYALAGHTMLDDTKGTHAATLSDDGSQLLHRFSSIDMPYLVDSYAANGKKLGTLLESENPLADYSISKPELFEIPAGDGSPLYGRLIKPRNFDPTKKHPVLVYVYGGPHIQLVRNTWMAGAPMWMYWFAEQGYIIATIDNRGSSNRGLEFEQQTYRKLGEVEMEDQKAMLDYLVSLPYIDNERMAIHGWSYGGFMTINMLLTFPGTFQAGVAGGPVCDWGYYEVMYTERYMDTPESNADGFKRSSIVERAPRLKDDLLVIHGTEDNVVVWQHSQAFVKSCIDAGVQLDYFIYPGHPHNVRGKDRVHLMTKVLTYIDERIGDGSGNSVK